VTFTTIVLILAAAVAHATWNLFSKQAARTGAACFVWLLGACATVAWAPAAAITLALPHPPLTGMNWLFLAGTGVLQSAYFLFLQLGYRLGDLSVVYPIGRGGGALLAAVGGIVLLHEVPAPIAFAGIAVIVAGIVGIGLPGRQPAAPGAAGRDVLPEAGPAVPRRAAPGLAILFAIVTGVFIASYSLWDKYAVATLHTPPLLQGYASFPALALFFAPVVLPRRDRLADVWREFRVQVLGAAVLAPLAYVLILVALRSSPVSLVAPAREVSVLFGVVLGGRLLGEGSVARRLTAAAAIVAGIIAVAIS
jgi:drug/metabolite transporter (DMT)-like permease